MAFQNNAPFSGFLRGVAAGATLAEVAPAENYILDERVPSTREDDFLAFNGFAAPFTTSSWFRQHADYSVVKVARAPISGTFDVINQPNWLGLQPDWDVVRIETISGLCGRASASGVSESEAGDLIRDLVAARETGTPMNGLREARLEQWLKLVNAGSDRRPAFVAPFAEVEPLLKQPDWANRLRDALGLGHIRPWAGRPTTVVLLQYNLERVYKAHIGKPAWAASPTVLDDVPRTMPNPCFFPAPRTASPKGFGFTVNLDLTASGLEQEFLHGHVTYMLDDFRRIGDVTTDISSAQIDQARQRHRALLSGDLKHLPDLPARP
jgi:hypothetical protein